MLKEIYKEANGGQDIDKKPWKKEIMQLKKERLRDNSIKSYAISKGKDPEEFFEKAKAINYKNPDMIFNSVGGKRNAAKNILLTLGLVYFIYRKFFKTE